MTSTHCSLSVFQCNLHCI